MRTQSILLLALSGLLGVSGSPVLAQSAPVPIEGPPPDADLVSRLVASANGGNVADEFRLGQLYVRGRGVPTDETAALGWFRKAADQGYAPAQALVGEAYRYGQGVTRSDATAIRWFRKAADQGFPSAQSSLGLMYAKGLGVPVDRVQAYKWLALAASIDGNWRGWRTTDHELYVQRRDDLAHKITTTEIAAAAKLADGWEASPQGPEPQSAVELF